MVTKFVCAVDDGPVELHFLVRPLAPFLASSWVLTPANGQDNIKSLHQQYICLGGLKSTLQCLCYYTQGSSSLLSLFYSARSPQCPPTPNT